MEEHTTKENNFPNQLLKKKYFSNQEKKLSIFYLQRIFFYERKTGLNHLIKALILDERIILHKTMKSTKNPQNRL